MEYTYRLPSPVGNLLLTSDGQALTGLLFDRDDSVPDVLPESQLLPVFAETLRWLEIYFSGRDPGFTPALAPKGSAFQQSVWRLLSEIPYGHTVSYGGIAKRIAEQRGIPRMSAQAVGGAVGSNPISLIIPCHRVIGADGSLVGYGGGMDKKIFLLKLEKVLP